MFFKVEFPLKPHPFAKLFPKYGEEELLDVASDIATMACTILSFFFYQGQILDGMNRHQVWNYESLRGGFRPFGEVRLRVLDDGS